MALAAVLLGSGIALLAFAASIATLALSPWAAFGLAVMAGQATFALVIVKGLICRALQDRAKARFAGGDLRGGAGILNARDSA